MCVMGGSIADWLMCWTQVQKGQGSNCCHNAVGYSCNSLRQTVHTHRASFHEEAKLVAAPLRVAGVTVALRSSDVTEETFRRHLKTFLFNCLDN